MRDGEVFSLLRNDNIMSQNRELDDLSCIYYIKNHFNIYLDRYKFTDLLILTVALYAILFKDEQPIKASKPISSRG